MLKDVLITWGKNCKEMESFASNIDPLPKTMAPWFRSGLHNLQYSSVGKTPSWRFIERRFKPHRQRGVFLVWAFSKPLAPNRYSMGSDHHDKKIKSQSVGEGQDYSPPLKDPSLPMREE